VAPTSQDLLTLSDEAIGLSLEGRERRQFEVEVLVAGDLVGAAS
jgi:hypothetical protein